MIKIGDELEGRISMNLSGSAYFVNNDLPKDIYIHRKNTNQSLHLDAVKIKVIKGIGRELEGIVTKIKKRFKTEYVGRIKITKDTAFLIPDSTKMPVNIFVPQDKLNGAIDDQKVVVKFLGWGKRQRSPVGEVIKVLGSSGENEVEMNSILHEYDLPVSFKEDVLAEAEAIRNIIWPSDLDKRRDMRNDTTFTIDPDNAKDFDDALSVMIDKDGNLEIGVHIADVSHYLRPDTDLDKEAYQRGTSVYLVDRVIPMLPERLSNGICSLRPNEDKLTFSVVFTMDSDGNVLNEWFGRTIINSNHRYTYEEAQKVIETINYDTPTNKGVIILDSLAKKIRAKRLKEGAITFDKEEVKFELDENSKPVGIYFKVSKDSNKLIEEFMLLANKHVAAILRKNEFPVINRVHEEPSAEKLGELANFIKQFGYKINVDTPEMISNSLNKLLIDIKDKPEENLITNLVLKSMQKAFYTTKPLGHYGLGFEDYAHFTSPIRRYPDVMVHRLLGRFLDKKDIPKVDKLESRCNYLSERERKAQKAERDSIKFMQCVYMSEKVGKIYEGIITSITEYGIFVQLNETKCDGMVKITDIPGDTFVTDLANYCVKGQSTNQKIKLGDVVNVIVSTVDIERKNINLMLINL